MYYLKNRKEVFIILYHTFIRENNTFLINYFHKNGIPLGPNQFLLNQTNIQSYKQMYLSQKKVSPDKLEKNIIGLNDTCKSCKSFHSTKTLEYNHQKNIATGIFLEQVFVNFLNRHIDFNAVLTTSLQLVSNQNEKIPQEKIKIFPDIAILNEKQALVAFIELKYHSAPFIKSKGYTGSYCYEGSLSMDVAKIEKQLEYLEKYFSGIPTFYLHWVDFPCIKGFFMESSFQVTESLKNSVRYSKITQHNEKKTNAHKFYSNLYTMTSLDEFITFLNINV